MAIKRPAEPPSLSSTVREARLQLGRPHCDSRPHAVRPDRAGKEQGRPAREGWWSEALQGGMCAASAASSITAPAQQHVDMDWTWDARPGDGSQNSVQVAGGRYRARPVVDRVNHARPHRRTRGLRDSMVLEGKADLQLPPGRALSGRAASLNASLGSGIALHKLAPRPATKSTGQHELRASGAPLRAAHYSILKGCACADAPAPPPSGPCAEDHCCRASRAAWQMRARGWRAPKRRQGAPRRHVGLAEYIRVL